MEEQKAFQDYYSDHFSHCYGCGRLNKEGLQIKSYWEGDETVCFFKPKEYHVSIPGYVYGGLIASIIDCHAIGSASAAIYKAEGRQMGSHPSIRCLTASLKVDYLKPTPLQKTLKFRGVIQEVKGRKVNVLVYLEVDGELCAKGEVLAIRIPEDFQPGVSKK